MLLLYLFCLLAEINVLLLVIATRICFRFQIMLFCFKTREATWVKKSRQSYALFPVKVREGIGEMRESTF